MRIEFDISDPSALQLTVLVRALTALNVLWLRAHPKAPLLSESGVRYESQPGGCERFRTIPDILAAGSGDCDQLAPWRSAELRVRHGIRAQPEVKRMGQNLWHVFVRYPDGRVEDVSARYGMKVPARIAALGHAILRRNHAISSGAHSPRSDRARRAFPA